MAKDYYATVDWTYTSGNDNAHITITDTDKLQISRPFNPQPRFIGFCSTTKGRENLAFVAPGSSVIGIQQ